MMTEQIWRCGVDRHFLDTVINSFETTGFSARGAGILLWVLAALAALGFAAWLLTRLRRLRPEEPFNWVVQPASIRRILERAMENRSVMELSFAENDQRRITTSCALLSLEAGGMVLEPPAKTGFSERFEDREMRVFFGAPSEKSPSLKVYYTGSCLLERVERIGPDMAHLHVGLPERLAVSQKREHLRIAPPLKLLGRLLMWPDTINGRNAFEAMILGEAYEEPVWPKLSLINLSAGGMAVEGHYQTRRMLSEESPGPGSEVYLYLELTQPGTGKPEPYFLLARVRHRLVVGVSVRLGIEFVQQVFADPVDGETLHRSSLGAEGVPMLDDWVVARHLELFREHGFW